ncbi:MAG: hypothetical protein HYZ43_17570 [Flavobacteriia bacterium]|nr:hypothetical protein [Flavobacteriia bacterium]
MKTPKFNYAFLAIVLYTALLCRSELHYLAELIVYFEQSDSSQVAASIGVVALLSGIIIYLFSELAGWIVFAIYGMYVAFDSLIGLFYGVVLSTFRGDYLYNPQYIGAVYMGFYFLFTLLSIAALYFLYRFLENNYSFNKKNWVYISLAGLFLALTYTYLIAEAWAHPN